MCKRFAISIRNSEERWFCFEKAKRVAVSQTFPTKINIGSEYLSKYSGGNSFNSLLFKMKTISAILLLITLNSVLLSQTNCIPDLIRFEAS